MRRAVYAGSFDPITLGYYWMIERGSHLFDELVVAIGINAEKKYTFTLAERRKRRDWRSFWTKPRIRCAKPVSRNSNNETRIPNQ